MDIQNFASHSQQIASPRAPFLHSHLSRLYARSCSFSSAPSGVLPSELKFIPLFKSDLQNYFFFAGLSEVYYSKGHHCTCRTRRSLTGGTLLKKENTCLRKLREVLKIQSLTERVCAYMWPGCVAVTSRDRTHLSLTGTSHMPKCFSVLQGPLPCQMRLSRLPDLSDSLQSDVCTTRTCSHIL